MKNIKIFIRSKLKNIEFLFNINKLFYKLFRIRSCYRLYNDKRKCIFIHIPKTAGRSFHRYLFSKDSPGHIPLKRYKILDEKKYNKYYKFCFIRKPSDRLYSAFNHYFKKSKVDEKLVKGKEEHFIAKKYFFNFKNFESFLIYLRDKKRNNIILQQPHFRPMVDWIHINNKIPTDLNIFPVEKIYKLKNFFDVKFDLTNEKFPKIGKESSDGVIKLYNESDLCKEIIHKFYNKDQKIYDDVINKFNN